MPLGWPAQGRLTKKAPGAISATKNGRSAYWRQGSSDGRNTLAQEGLSLTQQKAEINAGNYTSTSSYISDSMETADADTAMGDASGESLGSASFNSSANMSLFGGQPAQNTSQSLFGNTQTGNQQGTSLFGGLGSSNQSTQRTTTGGLFDLNAATSQQQAPNQSTSTSLFASNTQSQTQNTTATSAPSLFGGLGTNNNQNQANTSTGGSAFGYLNAARAPQQATSQPATGGSLFGASLVNNPQTGDQNQDQGAQQTQQSLQNGNGSTTAHFRNLIERGNRRKPPGETNDFGELPQLQLGLGDISGKLRNLGGVSSTDRLTNSRGRDILAASGVSRGATLRDLNSIAAISGGEPVPQPSTYLETDIEKYINNIEAKAKEDLFESALAQTNRDYQRYVEENVDINMEQARQRVYEYLGIVKPSARQGEPTEDVASPVNRGAFGKSSQRGPMGSPWKTGGSFGASGMSKSILGGSIGRNTLRGSLFTDVAEKATAAGIPPPVDDPFIRSKQEKYAGRIKELNAARKAEKVYPLVERLAHVELEAGTETPVHLIDAFKALKEIVKEKSNVTDPSELGAVRERQYARDYLDEAPNSGRSVIIRKQILDGSRKFLEDSFYQKLEDTVSRNPQEAKLGGIPSKINKVRAYLRIRAARKDLVGENAELQTLDDDYCWALLYYLLRCGLVQEAAEFVAEKDRALKAMDRHFGQYMSTYARDPERRLPREMQVRINSEYSQRARLAPDNSIDPYRMACYKIVGRCDLARKQIDGINSNIDDWLWLIFSLAREVNRVEEAAGEYFGLEEVRALIDTIGQRYFTPSSGDSGLPYATYFLMQILGGLFERGIAFLYAHNYVTAVHFAIALDYYGLLRVSDPSVPEADLLTMTTKGNPQISFGRLVGYYTRDFRMARAEAGTDYIVLICLNSDLPGRAGEAQTAACQDALRDLVLETRDFAMLLGDLQQNGQRIPGAIETRLPLLRLEPQDDFLRRLTLQAASVADDAGRVTDAVLLFHLAEDYDKVVVIVNRALSDALSVELGQEPMRLQPLKPRTTTQQGQAQAQASEYSLSLTSVDDPAELGRNLVSLYRSNTLYLDKIRLSTRNALGQLLLMSDARQAVEAGQTATALDKIRALEIVPLGAGGKVAVMQLAAQNLNELPGVVGRNIGGLLLWTITCLGRERAAQLGSAFAANGERAQALLQDARDLMVFAGLVRYKLPPDVYEMLARAGQDVGV